MNDEQQKEFVKIVSDVLISSTDNLDFSLSTTIFPGNNWSKLDETARLRAENKLIKSFQEGNYNSKKNICKSGSLGTWLSNIVDDLKLKEQFKYSLIKKLSSDNFEEIEYVMRYYRNNILTFDKEPEYSLIDAINKGLKKGDKRFYDLVSVEFSTPSSKWIEKIKENFENFEEKDLSPYPDDDDLPF